MATTFFTLLLQLFLFATLLPALLHGFPASPAAERYARHHVTSGNPERGLANMAAEENDDPSSSAGLLSKRVDLSINQELRSLANLLITRDYNRIRSARKNQEFLRHIGKRTGEDGTGRGRGGSLRQAKEEEEGEDGIEMSRELLPWEPFGSEFWYTQW